MSSTSQQFSLSWNNHSQHVANALDQLRANDEFTDVTLSCEGQRLQAHKVILSACSNYFKDTFKENPCQHPVIIIKGVSFVDLQSVVTFMYNGRVHVSQSRLPLFLQTAELLQIQGLSDTNESGSGDRSDPLKTYPAGAGLTAHSITQLQASSVHQQEQPINIETETSPESITSDPLEIQSTSPIPRKRKRMTPSTLSPPQPLSLGLEIDKNGSTSMSMTGRVTRSNNTACGSQSGRSLMSVTSPSTSEITNTGGNNEDPDTNIVKYEDEVIVGDEGDFDEERHMSSEDNDNSTQDVMGNFEAGPMVPYSGESAGTQMMESREDSAVGTILHKEMYELDDKKISIGFGKTGHRRLFHEGHTYGVNRVFHNNANLATYWLCLQSYVNKCKGRIVQKGDRYYFSKAHTC